MKSMIRTLIFCLLVSFNVTAQTPAQTVPVFDFYKFDKTAFTNKNLTPGKMSFFMFFDCDCDHCQHAMTNLNKNFQEYKKAAVYLISLDDTDKIKAFMQKFGPNVNNQKNVTMLLDVRNEFITRFNPRKYPSMFLYSADKKLLAYEDNPDNMFRFLKQLNASGK